MSRTPATLFLAAALALTAPPAPAQTPTIDLRHREQSSRIADGVTKGELDAGEAGRLMSRQSRQRLQEGRLKSDGVLTRRERKTIHRRQNLLDRAIRRMRAR